MTLRLYELADSHRLLFERIEELGGELTPELEAELDHISADLESKVDACCVRFAELRAEAGAIQAEIDRLKLNQLACVNQQSRLKDYVKARLKDYVKACLERANLSRVETRRFTARVQNSPPSARWTGDPDKIPAPFRREKHTVDFDAKAAIAADKAGDELPAGVEVRRGTHLVIQ